MQPVIGPALFTAECGSTADKTAVCFSLHRFGRDWLLSIGGGETHLGALSCSDKKRNTIKSLCLDIHKEESITRKVLAELSPLVEGELLVIAGIHYDNINRQQIETILHNCDQLIDRTRTFLKSL